MLKYKDFETLNYMRDIVKSWTEKADSPAIIDNTDFLTGRQCAAIAKAAIDVMEANGPNAATWWPSPVPTPWPRFPSWWGCSSAAASHQRWLPSHRPHHGVTC